MSHLFHRIFCLLALAAVSSAMQIHVVCIQTYAWVTMVLDKSQEVELIAAIDETFSGEKPCKYCTMVNDTLAQDISNEQPSTHGDKQQLLKLALDEGKRILIPKNQFLLSLSHDSEKAYRLVHKPSIPPPKPV